MSSDNASSCRYRGNIFLIGIMGVGKTSLGRFLGCAISRQFVDCDEEIEKTSGISIERIFNLAGEAAFRQLEEQILSQLVQRDSMVLSTGGGVVLSAANRTALRSNGYVVYLSAPLPKLLARIRLASSSQRPMLQVADVEQRLSTLLAQRAPLYCETADTEIAIGNASVKQLAQKIMRNYNKANNS